MISRFCSCCGSGIDKHHRSYIYIYMFIYMYTSLCVCSIRPTTWAAAMHVVACVCALFAAAVFAPDNVYIYIYTGVPGRVRVHDEPMHYIRVLLLHPISTDAGFACSCVCLHQHARGTCGCFTFSCVIVHELERCKSQQYMRSHVSSPYMGIKGGYMPMAPYPCVMGGHALQEATDAHSYETDQKTLPWTDNAGDMHYQGRWCHGFGKGCARWQHAQEWGYVPK